ncbi:MAG TPA: hypothetical protein PKG82_11480, partial [Myxococcota bacterium]|nr:hypothetical protein [Myxococcota bacterium]
MNSLVIFDMFFTITLTGEFSFALTEHGRIFIRPYGARANFLPGGPLPIKIWSYAPFVDILHPSLQGVTCNEEGCGDNGRLRLQGWR